MLAICQGSAWGHGREEKQWQQQQWLFESQYRTVNNGQPEARQTLIVSPTTVERQHTVGVKSEDSQH